MGLKVDSAIGKVLLHYSVKGYVIIIELEVYYVNGDFEIFSNFFLTQVLRKNCLYGIKTS